MTFLSARTITMRCYLIPWFFEKLIGFIEILPNTLKAK
jgi:hypothetical protein